MNEEVAMVEPVLEEEQTSVLVGFDICGTNSEPDLPTDQGKPRMHLNLPCVWKALLHFINALLHSVIEVAW
jgi:hypothetical protein